jgi:small subunit ribosomal protein S1
MTWKRIKHPSELVHLGQEIDVVILHVDRDKGRVALGLKQKEENPWEEIEKKYPPGTKVRGKIVNLVSYGAFIEIENGIEGLIHVSEMSWARRVRHPSDVVQVGEEVEAVVLEMNIPKRRVALGLKQALGDPWDRLEKEHPVGSAVAGTVRKITNFGAFVEVLEGIEGLLHISDITSDRRLKSPSEVIKVGDEVQVQVLEIQRPKRRLKLGMKQLEPTSQEQFAAEVNVGDVVSGRVLGVSDNRVEVELGEGVRAFAPAPAAGESQAAAEQAGDEDVSSLGARLKEAWKTGGAGDEQVKAGELRSFKIARVDAEKGLIELESA